MIRVGIVGAGGMGNVHARHYRSMPEVEISFYESDPEKAGPYAEKWQASPASSLDDLIRAVDVIDICLPTHVHAETALKAIAAGRHIFVEKPLAGTAEDAAKVVAAADRAGVILMPGQVVRFFPEFAAGKRMVEQGEVGKPAAARTRRGGGQPRSDWFKDYARSGGVIVDLAIHDFDWLRWTLGEVKHLYARSVGLQDGSWPDYALTTMTFDSGAISHTEATWMDPGGSRVTFEVAGSEGLVEYDSRQTASLRTVTSDKTINESPLAGSDDPYLKELTAFLASVRYGADIPVTGLDGVMAVSIAMAAVESAKTGKVVAPARQF